VERKRWEIGRALFYSDMFGPPKINITGEAPGHHFAEFESQKHSRINVETAFEEMSKTVEDLLYREGTDYFKVLGLDNKADVAAVKKAYREELRKWHPDTYQGNDPAEAAKNFRLVCNAYQMLTNEEARQGYEKARAAASSS